MAEWIARVYLNGARYRVVVEGLLSFDTDQLDEIEERTATRNRRAPPQDIPEEGAPEGGPNGGDGLRIRDRGTDNPLEIVDSARGERPIRPPSPSPLLVDDLPDWAFRFIRPAINRLLLDRPDPLLHRPNRLQ